MPYVVRGLRDACEQFKGEQVLEGNRRIFVVVGFPPEKGLFHNGTCMERQSLRLQMCSIVILASGARTKICMPGIRTIAVEPLIAENSLLYTELNLPAANCIHSVRNEMSTGLTIPCNI